MQADEIINPDEIRRKLAMIAELCPQQLQGWIDEMRQPDARPAFPGERQAVQKRLKQLAGST